MSHRRGTPPRKAAQNVGVERVGSVRQIRVPRDEAARTRVGLLERRPRQPRLDVLRQKSHASTSRSPARAKVAVDVFPCGVVVAGVQDDQWPIVLPLQRRSLSTRSASVSVQAGDEHPIVVEPVVQEAARSVLLGANANRNFLPFHPVDTRDLAYVRRNSPASTKPRSRVSVRTVSAKSGKLPSRRPRALLADRAL